MAQNIQLKRSSLPGKVPDTGSLNLGEIAINTYDGKVFFKKSGSLESIESVITTNSINTGSITLTQTGSFGELVVTQDVNIQRDLYVTNDIVGNGDIDVLGNITGSNLLIKGTLTAQSYIVSSSVVNMTTQFASGSTIFGNSLDDTHQFTGSVNITGSGYINSNRIITDADTGSFATSGGYPESGVDYNTDSTTVADFNIESPQFLVDYLYETSVGTEVGLKGFIGNTSGSTLVVPANDFIGFVIDDVEVARVTANGFEGISLPSGLISGSSQLTSSYDTRYVISGSITQTTWDNIASKPGGIVSGSSQVTASLDTRYVLSGSVGSGGGLDSRSQMLSQSVAATTWSFNHNLGSQYPIISVYGSTGEIIQPQTIKTIDINNLEITFGTPISGIAVASLGSLTEVTGRTVRQDFTSSVSWSFNHNLGDRYVMIQTFDTANDMMLPQSVTLTDTTSSLITFTEAVSGYALATIGGGLPAISSSYNGYTLQVQSGTAVWTSVLSASVATASYVEYNNIGNKPTLISGSAQVVGILSSLNQFSASNENTSLNLYTSSNDSLNSLQTTRIDQIALHTSSLNSYTSSNETRWTSFFTYSSSTDNRLSNIESKSGSVDISINNINSFTASNGNTSLNTYTSSLNNAIQLTGSTVSFLGNIVVYGTQSIINSQNVEISDNILYLAPTGSIDNDLGVVGHYNDGVYRHAGIFMDASDGHSWKVFNGLQSETSAQIDTAGTGFTLADFKAGAFTGTSFNGQILSTNNVLSSSYQVVAALPTGTVSGSTQVVGILSSLNAFSASQETKDTTISALTASYSSSIGQINSVTASLNSKTGSYATTGSNTFIGNQTIVGTTNLTDNTATGNGDKTVSVVANKPGVGYHNYNHNAYQHSFYVGGSQTLAMNIGTTGNITPGTTGTQDLGSTSLRWGTIYTSDLSLNNGIGDWTIVEGEDDLFLYNNKKGKVYKFALTEVDPSVATPKKS